MSRPVNCHLSDDLYAAALWYAEDEGLRGVTDVMRMALARHLSKQGYYRTQGRGWRKGQRDTSETTEPDRTPAEHHASTRMVFGEQGTDATGQPVCTKVDTP